MIKSTKFDSGLMLVTDSRPDTRSASVSFWVGAGSGFETPENNGISHFTEHVMFKGTAKYSPFEIAKLFEDYGARFNAFTSKEATCYYFKCIDENLEKCFALMAHILYKSSFDADELDKERKVITEEINMVEDEPDDICYDKLAECAYKGTALARTILGPTENVLRFTRDDVLDYTGRMYVPGNTVISVAGNVGHERMEELTEKYVAPVIGAPGQAAQYSPAACGVGFAKYEKDFEQVNLAVAYPTLPFDHELSAVQNVVSFCFGTGMSSRLFQVLREQKGLVYNVYTACSAYKNNGLFGIYVNTSGKNLAAAADAVRDETEKLREGGLTEEELTRAKIQLKSSMLFSLEDMLSTMNAYGKYALYTRGLYDTDARLKMIESVTREQTAEFCRKYFVPGRVSVAYVGKSDCLAGTDLYGKFSE